MSNKSEIISNQNQLKIADLFLLLGAVFILSLAPILIRLSETEISPNATLFNRFWITTVFLGLWYGIKNIGNRDSSSLSNLKDTDNIRILIMFVVLAICDLGCFISWAWSLTETSVANSNLLHNMIPVFATIGGWLFLNHRFSRTFIAGAIVAVAGTSIIGIADWQIADDRLTGDILALLSAFFYAISYLIMEKLRENFSATTILQWACFFRTLLILPVLLISQDRIFPISWSGWLTVISLGILCEAIGQVIVVHSLKKFSAGFVSLFLLFDPVMAAILSAVIFAERLSLTNWFAFAVILIGIYLAQSGNSGEKNNPQKLEVNNL